MPRDVREAIPRRLLSLVCLLAALLLAGCPPGTRPAPQPMPTLTLEDSPSSCAVVFLPGVLDKPRDFDEKGFVAAVEDAGLDLQLVAADAHLTYYRNRTVFDLLHRDVVAPRVAEGKEVWLVGISLGGMGSLIYSWKHPDDLAGIVLLAPFLGNKKVLREIEDAGGVLRWEPPEVIEDKDVGRKMWAWLKEWRELPEDERPEIYLGYGESDGLAEANSRLAALLDEDHVFLHPAGHHWKAWLPLWQNVLASGVFDGCGVPLSGKDRPRGEIAKKGKH